MIKLINHLLRLMMATAIILFAEEPIDAMELTWVSKTTGRIISLGERLQNAFESKETLSDPFLETISQDLRKDGIPAYEEGKFPYDRNDIIDMITTPSWNSGVEIKREIEVEEPIVPLISSEPLEFGEGLRDIKINIFDYDRREVVKDTTLWPYRIHGQLIMRFRNGEEYEGSGTMLGPHHVLTAAHNIFSHKPYKREKDAEGKKEGWATEVIFTPAASEGRSPFGSAKGAILLSVKGWVLEDNPRYNLGMIILDTPLGHQTGWGGLISVSELVLKSHVIHITGYPTDKKEGQMWTERGKVKSVTPDLILYDIYMYLGLGGSIIWSLIGDNPYILGIHTFENQDENGGIRLGLEKLKRLINWMQQYQLVGGFTHPYLPSKEEEEQTKNYKAYKEKAKKGDAEAQYNLGLCYLNGMGVPNKSTVKAIKWFKKAIEKRDLKAKKGDPKAEWIGECCYILGECYYKGEGIPSKYLKGEEHLREMHRWAFRLFKKAAIQGHAMAQFSLAQCYERGHGVEHNPKEAFEWYKKAARNKHLEVPYKSEVQYRLGEAYYNGKGEGKNPKKAVDCYHEADHKGHPEASYKLGICYEYGEEGISKNLTNSIQFYHKAASKGHLKAQYRLGLYYEYGQGIDKDIQYAVTFYHKAASKGHTHAQYRLGEYYENGERGEEKNLYKAFEFYKEAAEQGYIPAVCKVAECYKNGWGIEQSRERAIYWLKKAKELTQKKYKEDPS